MQDNPFTPPQITVANDNKGDKNYKLRPHEHIVAGIPLILVVAGGAIGGGIGGGAYYLSSIVFKKRITSFKKYFYSILISIGAAVLYLTIIAILALIFPNAFAKT